MLMLLLFWGQLTVEPDWQRDLDDYEVYRARALAVADNGHVALIDRDANAVLIVRDNGEEVARIDRNGQGPGELQAPVEICWSTADRAFVVADFGNARLSKWSAQGELISEHTMTGNLLHPRFAGKNTYFSTRNAGGLNGPRLQIMRFTLGETEGSEAWGLDQPERIDNTAANMGDGNMVRILFRWDPFLLYGLSDDLLVTAYGNERQIRFLDHNGKAKRPPVRLELPRYEVTDLQMDMGVELMPANMHAAIRRGLVKPEGWPYIRSVHVDEKNRVWVTGSAQGVGKPCPIRVLSGEGKQLGEGWVADVVLDVRNDALYYITEREEGLFFGKAKVKLAS